MPIDATNRKNPYRRDPTSACRLNMPPGNHQAQRSRRQHGQSGRATPDNLIPATGSAPLVGPATIPWQSAMATSFGQGV